MSAAGRDGGGPVLSGESDMLLTDVNSLSGYLDACLDGLGRTDVSSLTWLREYQQDSTAEQALHVRALTRQARAEGASEEREAVLASLKEYEAELSRIRNKDALDGGRVAGVQEAAYIVRARNWPS